MGAWEQFALRQVESIARIASCVREHSSLGELAANKVIEAFLRLLRHSGSTTQKCQQACIAIHNTSDHKAILREFQTAKSDQFRHFVINSILWGSAILVGLLLCIYSFCLSRKVITDEAKRKRRKAKINKGQIVPVTAIIPPLSPIIDSSHPSEDQPPLPPPPPASQPKYQVFA